MRTKADEILEELRELYNQFVQDDDLGKLGRFQLESAIVEILTLVDELDNRLLTGQPLPLDWRR